MLGPGPWFVADLGSWPSADAKSEHFNANGDVNFGAGLEDEYPCPLHPTQEDRNKVPERAAVWTDDYTCDPATCTSDPTAAAIAASQTSGTPNYPNEVRRRGGGHTPLRVDLLA